MIWRVICQSRSSDIIRNSRSILGDRIITIIRRNGFMLMKTKDLHLTDVSCDLGYGLAGIATRSVVAHRRK